MNQSREQFKKALAFTLPWEGGFSDSGTDLGGRTMKGITQKTYDQYRIARKLPKADVKNISEEEVENLYFEDFWVAGKCFHFQWPLSAVVFDTCVQFGIVGSEKYPGAIRLLQKAVGENPDGVLGALTMSAANGPAPIIVANALIGFRMRRRHERVKENNSQKVYLMGWLNRDVSLMSFVNSNKEYMPRA